MGNFRLVSDFSPTGDQPEAIASLVNGIKNGLVITQINDQAVNSSDDVEEIYRSIMKSSDDKVMIIKGFYEVGRKVYIAVNIADEE